MNITVAMGKLSMIWSLVKKRHSRGTLITKEEQLLLEVERLIESLYGIHEVITVII